MTLGDGLRREEMTAVLTHCDRRLRRLKGNVD
jgi:hypothetical protein